MSTSNSLPQLIAEFKANHPQLTTRIERGAALALQPGAVIELGHNTWQVASQSGPEPYVVTFNLAWSCNCKDCQQTGHHPAPRIEFAGGVQPVCKHIVAAALSWLAADDIQAQRYDAFITHQRRQAPAPDKYRADLGYTDKQLAQAPTAEYRRVVAQARRAA